MQRNGKKIPESSKNYVNQYVIQIEDIFPNYYVFNII